MQTILRVKMGYPLHHQSTEGKQLSAAAKTQLDWAEVSRFHQERDRAAIQREKDLVERRKREVKDTLDKQMGERMVEIKRIERDRA